jgi:rSAM/selenodomain-associated transferase 1
MVAVLGVVLVVVALWFEARKIELVVLKETAKQRLIIFTRYPQPGQVKTRLIPALGAEGATNLHRQMTEHTLSQVRTLRSTLPLSIQVYFSGGNQQDMQAWLGDDLVYQPQADGDLGSRMMQALSQSFQDHMDYAVIIGTDCPSLSADFIAKAFILGLSHDLVLGPAIDGGYYLIGLRHFLPELFSGISWSTAEVLQQTVTIAHKLNLSVAYLPPLADIDRPEDLLIWEKIRNQK